jgi:hypothetical protein
LLCRISNLAQMHSIRQRLAIRARQRPIRQPVATGRATMNHLRRRGFGRKYSSIRYGHGTHYSIRRAPTPSSAPSIRQCLRLRDRSVSSGAYCCADMNP